MVDTLKKKGVKDHAEDNFVSGDFYEALDEKVKELIDRATRRAEGNDRRTIKPRDV